MTTQTSTAKEADMEDLVMLPKVSNEAIMQVLKQRYLQDKIYTNIGPVLLSVNPFRHIPKLCDDEQIFDYKDRLRFDVPPNIFALADEAYQNLKKNENQCVIITGESGAGKTEAAKLIIKYISAVTGKSKDIDYVKSVILNSNPVLEAFGNAKTLRNNNSSRFGKYFEIQFDAFTNPVGGKINHYLLESSRVVRQVKEERGFHIFYQLLSARSRPEIVGNLHLMEPKNYKYLSGSGQYLIEGTDDRKDFEETMESMRIVGITDAERFNVFSILAGILTLGNVTFSEKSDGSVNIVDENSLTMAAQLLQVNVESLKKALTSRVLTTGAGTTVEVYNVMNNKIQADAARDSVSRTIYSRLFDWIVDKINCALSFMQRPFTCVLGVLDIYGFEIFETNGFEQFCINYVNEKLQQHFIELTLRAEQEEYRQEGISWSNIDFFNNKAVVDLIDSKTPPGIFSILDDVCFTMHSASSNESDSKFVQKCSTYFGGNNYYNSKGTSFEIKHYAGEVMYNSLGFCDRNKDTLTQDLIELMQSSRNTLLVSFFPEDISKHSKRPTTSGFKFRTSCQQLVDALRKCYSFYIRTIKPNQTKKPGDWSDSMVTHQVKYLGLLENVRVRRAGYAYRDTFQRFINRYKKLSNRTWNVSGEWRGDAMEGSRLILIDSKLNENQWKLGKTKVFIRHPESLFFLEACLEQFEYEKAALIQKAWRNYKEKQKLLELRNWAHTLLHNRKERRSESTTMQFVGDYVNYDMNVMIQSALKLRDERVVFGDQVVEFSRRGECERRDLLLTPNTLYILRRVNVNRQLSYAKKEVLLRDIKGISMSKLQDNMVVVHVAVCDVWVSCKHKTELAALLIRALHALNSGINIAFSDTINVQRENEFVQQLEFSKATQQQMPDVKIIKSGRTFRITVNNGLPASTLISTGSVSQRSSRSNMRLEQQQQHLAPPTPKSSPRCYCRAQYDYDATDNSQISFRVGDVIEITHKDPGGWWEGVLNGQVGWIPSGYVQEI